jgi:hypothetical protein
MSSVVRWWRVVPGIAYLTEETFRLFKISSPMLETESTNILMMTVQKRVLSFTARPIYPVETAPGTHWTGGWVGPRAGLNSVEKRKYLSLRRESNPHSSVVYSLVTTLTQSESESESRCDRRSVGQSVLVSSPIWGSWPEVKNCLTVRVFLKSCALSDEGSGLSFVTVLGRLLSIVNRWYIYNYY